MKPKRKKNRKISLNRYLLRFKLVMSRPQLLKFRDLELLLKPFREQLNSIQQLVTDNNLAVEREIFQAQLMELILEEGKNSFPYFQKAILRQRKMIWYRSTKLFSHSLMIHNQYRKEDLYKAVSFLTWVLIMEILK